MGVSRRHFVVAGAAGIAGTLGVRALGGDIAAGSGLPLLRFDSPPIAPFRDELPILSGLRPGASVALSARTTSHQFHRDYSPSPALAYQSTGGGPTYLGPALEVSTGETLAVRLSNEIGAHPFAADVDPSLHGVRPDFASNPSTTLHLHGGVVPPSSDGHPQDYIVRSESLTNTYPNRQDATALWLHDHSLGTTRLNVYAGLAMPYLIRDEWDTGKAGNRLGLPAGDFEVTLVLQEKIFSESGRQSVRSTPIVPQGRWEGGAVGDRGVVNGKVWPELSVARGLYRFRLYNAGSYSIWNLFFSNRMRFWVIGSEGGLLDAPVPVTSLRMGPAERYDVLVDFGTLLSGETVELRNDEPVPSQAAEVGEVTMPLFCRFRATSAAGFRGAVPTTLRGAGGPSALPSPAPTNRVRNLTINQLVDPTRVPPAFMTLNNLRFTDPDIEMPSQGSYEIWNLINVATDPHILHIHLVNFRVLERRPFNSLVYQALNPPPPLGHKWAPSAEPFVSGPAQAPMPYERGWKDTVIVNPSSITRVAINWPNAPALGFDPDAAFLPQGPTARAEVSQPASMPGMDMPGGAMPGMEMTSAAGPLRGYMWHCHMLDHEDHDMMLPFRVVAGG